MYTRVGSFSIHCHNDLSIQLSSVTVWIEAPDLPGAGASVVLYLCITEGAYNNLCICRYNHEQRIMELMDLDSRSSSLDQDTFKRFISQLAKSESDRIAGLIEEILHEYFM